MKRINSKNIISILIFSLFLISCKENSTDIKIDYPTQLNGTWTIVQSFATNGPICFFLEVGDNVSFIVTPSENGILFNYNTGKQKRSDFFTYTLNGNILSGEGEYSTSSHIEPIFIYDAVLPQYLDIEFLDENKIHCRFRMGTKSPYTNEILIGDISNFIAKKH
ncbi:MAG: hypothetical protein V1779_06040 [bacterium]